MTTKEKIAVASILGTQAFKEGKERNFWKDSELVKMLDFNNKFGSKEGKESNKIMKAWIDSWDVANFNSPLN